MEDIKQARDFFFIYWLFMYILFGSEGLILTFEQVKFKNSNGIPIRCISYQFLKRRSEIKKKNIIINVQISLLSWWHAI